FFGREGRRLKVPDLLKGMEECFPSPEALPEEKDVDGSQWVKEVGPVRADLTLTSLGLVRDFMFLVPPGGLTREWDKVKKQVTSFLARPATENLAAVRVILAELAEGVTTRTLEDALRAREADIELDPQFVAPNEKTRLTVRFRNSWLNTAAARRYVVCEWAFEDQYTRRWPRPRAAPYQAGRTDRAAKDDGNRAGNATPYRERGWEIYHYFEPDVALSRITVQFYRSDIGKPVSVTPPQVSDDGLPEPEQPSGSPLTYERTVRPPE